MMNMMKFIIALASLFTLILIAIFSGHLLVAILIISVFVWMANTMES